MAEPRVDAAEAAHETAVAGDAPGQPGSDESAPKMRREVLLVFPGLMLALTLAMLDNFIVGTALPRIAGDLGGLEHLSWVVTAYILGTTVSTPVWGKLGDQFGRKRIFLTAIVIFLVGSMLSGAAGSQALSGLGGGMTQLILFRAIQGLGAGGLMVNVMAIIGEMVSPRERGRYQGIMAAVMSLSMLGGPLLGGLITDHWSWRWTFYVNVPIGGLALVVIATTLHLPRRSSPHKIDWLGAGLLGVGITGLVLITTWGGQQYPWLSAQILGLAVLSVLCLVALAFVEPRAAEPMLPLTFFKNRNFSLINGIGFLMGFAMFGAMTFLPLFQQIVQGASATNSGILLMPMMISAMIVSLVAGQVITKTGRYKFVPVLGGLVMVVAMYLLASQTAQTSPGTTAVYIALLGLGLGGLMQTTLLIAQNSLDVANVGVASSTATFFRSIGGSFGVAAFGAIFTHNMSTELDARFPGASSMLHSGQQLSPDKISLLPPVIREGVIESMASAISSVFGWALIAAILVPVLALAIKEIPLRNVNAPDPSE